jgi:hypothetical protein
MATSIGPRTTKGGVGMPIWPAFILGTAGVIAALWLAWLGLTSDSVPVVGNARGVLMAMAIIGMAACAVGGIGQAPIIGWAHPITIFGIVVGVLALLIVGAGLFGWDGLVRPAAGLVPMGTTVAATTERLAIGLLGALIVAKWAVGIPLSIIIGQR